MAAAASCRAASSRAWQGSLDRGGLPFGLPAGGHEGVLAGLAGGGQVHGSALCVADRGVALADGGVMRGGGLRGLAFCGFGAGLGCAATPSTAGGRRVRSGDAAKTGEPLALSRTDR
jgi:hypothetical protein